MNILIVDDDEKRSASIADFLIAKNCAEPCEIFLATNSDKAKELLKVKFFDALLLDVVLPKRDKEKASCANSYELLDQLNRRSALKRPGIIIGITSHYSDLGQYRDGFSKFCTSVLEASSRSSSWKSDIEQALKRTIESQLAKLTEDRSLNVLTVHGIRTFGQWQNRLKQLVSTYTGSVDFHNYKYGYFSIFSFLVPFLRNREVKRFKRQIELLIEEAPNRDIIIFCHSFGTYIVVQALKSIQKAGGRPPVKMLVLSGSVLRSDFDWSFAKSFESLRVVNDCGVDDFVLWLSDGLVPLLGKAGKVGFHGFNNDKFLNRFFSGGHGLYFQGDEFMSKYWLPLLDLNRQVVEVDHRVSNILMDEVFEKIVGLMSALKEVIYFLLFVVFLYWFLL